MAGLYSLAASVVMGKEMPLMELFLVVVEQA